MTIIPLTFFSEMRFPGGLQTRRSCGCETFAPFRGYGLGVGEITANQSCRAKSGPRPSRNKLRAVRLRRGFRRRVARFGGQDGATSPLCWLSRRSRVATCSRIRPKGASAWNGACRRRRNNIRAARFAGWDADGAARDDRAPQEIAKGSNLAAFKHGRLGGSALASSRL
jgi:hypothetical protein